MLVGTVVLTKKFSIPAEPVVFQLTEERMFEEYLQTVTAVQFDTIFQCIPLQRI